MGQKVKKTLSNSFGRGMYLDSLVSSQPDGTYRESWGITNKTDDESLFGVSNASANEIHIKLPNGIIRALLYVEERDYYIAFFKMNSGVSEIGILDEKSKSYIKVVDDNDLQEPLKFSDAEWNSVTAKVMQPCNNLYLYWSNSDYYYRINIDDKCRDWKSKPIRLMREHCIGKIEAVIMDGGNLPNGIYQAFMRLRDSDGNQTNWFRVNQPIPIGQGHDGDNMAGDNSRKSINIKTEGLHEDYGIVDIGIFSTVGGVSVSKWVDTVAYGKGKVDYHYRGDTGKEIPISISEVIGRKDMYIRGSNLAQFDGRLVLYNLIANNNIDWQGDVNNFKIYWQVYGVPIREAHKYKGLRPNENYWFGIHENYTDGTKSADFMFIGRDGSNSTMIQIPGCDCEVPEWEVKDTTIVTNTFCDLSKLIHGNKVDITMTETGANDITPDYEPDPSDPTGGVVVGNNQGNADGGKTMDEIDKTNDEASGGSSSKDLKTLRCMCDKLVEVLFDAEKLGGGDLEKSVRFAGINKKEIYEMACACQAAKDENGEYIYPPNLFHNFIISIVE